MVGQGVLRECLLDPDVERVVTLGRTPTGQRDPKLEEIVHADLFNPPPITNIDACFFCLGVSSAGMSEEEYTRISYELTLTIAKSLLHLNPRLKFIYVSGAGTGGRSMWARVKGRTENALLQLPFEAAYMFRPALIQPMHGIRSKTRLYQAFYSITRPLLPLLKRFPSFFTTTEQVGRAMLAVAKHGYPKRILESADINRT